jgi:hypothetical protein
MLLLCRDYEVYTVEFFDVPGSAAQVLVEEKCLYAGKFGGLCCKGTDHLHLPLLLTLC